MKKTLLLLTMCLLALSNAFGAMTWYVTEDFESGHIPTSWTQEVISSNVADWVIEPTSAATYPATGNESNYYVALRNNTGMDQHYVTKLISPAINFAAAPVVYNPQLVFNHAQPGYGTDFDTLKVYYRQNANAPWMLLQVFSNRLDAWTMDTVALIGYNGATAYQIAFEAVENMGRGIVLDDISVFNASACQPTTDLTVTFCGATSVSMVWSGDLMADTFQILLTKSEVVDWNDYTPAYIGYATDFSTTIDELDHSTTYYAYVRSKCDDNETGWTNWASTSFSTRMLADVPYNMAFTSSFPDGWKKATDLSSTKPTFSSGSSYSIDSTYAMVFSGITAGNYAYAITPELNLRSASGAQVSFWGAAGTYVQTPANSNVARLYIGVMNDPEDSSTLVIVDSVEIKVANKHQRFDVSLANYTGTGRYVVFFAGNQNRNTYFYLDNLSVTVPEVFVPGDVKIINATPDGFDVSLDLKGATSWNLRVASAAYYKHKGVLPATFLQSQDGLTGNTYHVSGQFGDSIVSVYVQGVKNGATSDWSFPVTLKIPARASLPVNMQFTSGQNTELLRKLDKEFNTSSTAVTFPGLYFQLLDFSNFYPKFSSSAPTYNTGHLILQGTDRWIALPYVDSFAGLMLSFRLAAANLGQSRIALGVMEDAYDLSTFTQLAVCDGEIGIYTKFEFDLDSLAIPAGKHYLAIRAIEPASPNATYGSVNHIDDLVLDVIPTCRPAAAPVVNISPNEVTLTWKTKGMNKWLVNLFTSASADSVVASQEVTAPSATFNNLDSAANYYYQINTLCGEDTAYAEEIGHFMTPYFMPFEENFDALRSGVPANWNNSVGSITVSSQKWTYYATGYKGKCLRFNSVTPAEGAFNELALPSIYLNERAVLRFYWKNPKGGLAQVLVSTDGGNTRTVLMDSALLDVAGWKDMEVSLVPYVGHTVNLYIKSISNHGSGDAYHYLDSVRVITAPTCMHVTKLNVSNITFNGASISWTPGENETQWQYVAVPENGTLNWDNAILVNGTPAARISNLSGNTSYTVYVRAYCSASDQGGAESKSFKTPCGPVSAFPWNEGFEAYEGSTYDATGDAYQPECWTTYANQSVVPHVVVSGTYAYIHEGTKALDFYGVGNCVAELPLFGVPLNTLKVNFWVRYESESNGQMMFGYFMPNDTTFHPIVECPNQTSYVQYDLLLDTIPATAERLAFWYFSASSTNWNCCIDDIRVSIYDASCGGLRNLRASAGSAHDGSILWTVAGVGSASVDIQVSDSANFANPTTYLAVTANPFTLSGLASNQTYYVRARQTCDVNGEWLSTSFKTLCEAISPDNYPVQTFRNAGDMDCWVVGVATPGKNTSRAPYVTSATSRGNYLYFTKSATSSDTITYGDGLFAIMPELDIDTINRYEVTFSACKTSTATGNMGSLAVGVITDPADFSTFTAMTTLRLDYAADTTTMKNYTVNFMTYAGDYNDDYGKYIMFLAQSGDSANAIAVDNVEISIAHTCPQVVEGHINSAEIEQTSAVYRWNSVAAESYQVAVLTSIANPDEEEPVFFGTTTADSIVITGLTPATNYYAYVRATCGESDYSRWSAHTRFQSACGIAGVPFYENFNNLTSEIPVCWNNDEGTTTNVSYKWGYVEKTGNGNCAGTGPDGSNCIQFDSYMNSNGNTNVLATPEINLDRNATLTFYWKNPAGGDASVSIASVNDTIRTELIGSTALVGITEWTEMEVDLSQFAGQTVKIYFEGISNYGNDDAYLYLDEVRISATASCRPLAAIVVSDISRRSAKVNLMPKPGSSRKECELVWSERALNNTALDSVAKVIVDTTGIYTITGLSRATHYFIYARVNCGNEGMSEWVSTELTTKNIGPDCRDIEPATLFSNAVAIQYVPWADYYNSTRSEQIYTKAELEAQGLQAGYISNVAFQYALSSSYTKTVTLFMGMTNQTELTGSAFMDLQAVTGEIPTIFNTDGQWYEFELSTPYYWDGESNLVVGMLAMGTNYPPTGTPTFYGSAGTTNMARYSRSDSSIPSASSGTLTTNRANIRLLICPPGSACPDIRNLRAELVGAGVSQAIIRWDASDADYLSGYDVVFSGTPIEDPSLVTPTAANIQFDSLEINGLNPETEYYVYVRANCMAEGMNDGSSNWAELTFSTLANCPAVTNLTSALSTAANAVSVSWIPAFADQDLRFAYVCSTDSLDAAALAAAEKTYVNDTVAFELLNLSYGQKYYIYVASVCGNSFSPWSKTVIVTDPACAPVRNLATTRIEHNRVVLSWNRSMFGTETQWEAGIVGDSASIVIVNDTAETISTMLISLTAETEYTAYVHAICSEGETSANALISFTTTSVPSGCFIVGSGTSTSSYLPTDSYYNNSFTQQIFTPEELGRTGALQAISFYNGGTEKTRLIDVYVTGTSKAAFSGGSDWATVNASDMLFSGNVTFTEDEWTTLTLSTPYIYDGLENLLIVVDDHTGSWSSGLSCASFSGSENRAIYSYRDSAPYTIDGMADVTGTVSTSRNQIQFCFENDEECPAVTSMKVQDITTTTAVASWEPMGDERAWLVFLSDTVITDFRSLTVDTSYSYVYPLSGLNADTDYHLYVQPICGGDWRSVAFTTVAICSAPINLRLDSLSFDAAVISWTDEFSVGTSYVVAIGVADSFNLEDTTTYRTIIVNNPIVTINGLESLTSYSVAVKSLCVSDLQSRWSEVGTFKTECGLEQLPWSDGFEGDLTCWKGGNLQSSASSYLPGIITSAQYVHSGTKALELYAYVSYYTTADSAFVIVPEIDYDTIGISGTTLRFWALNYSSGSSYYPHVQVGVISGMDIHSFQLVEDVTITENYTEYEVSFAGYNGDGNRVVFMAVTDPNKTGSSGYCNFFLDDLQIIETPACVKPAVVTVESVVDDTVHFSWIAGGEETQWQYLVIPAGTTPDWTNAVTTTVSTATVSGLSLTTSYNIYVRSYCSGSDYSDSRMTTFATPCGPITSLPWHEGFEAYEGGEYNATNPSYQPACWTTYADQSVTPHVVVSGSYAYIHEGSKALDFYGVGNCVAELPRFDVPLNTLKVSFWVRYESTSNGQMAFGYFMPNDTAFHPIVTCPNQQSYVQYEMMLDTIPATAERLAFWYYSVSATNWNCCIDDIHVSQFDLNCAGLSGLRLTATSLNSATLAWGYAGGNNNAQIQVALDEDFENIIDSASLINATSYIITGLQASTTYYARGRQICESGFSEWANTLSFTTSYGVPFVPQFSTTTIPSDWMKSNTDASLVFAGNPMETSSSGWSLVASDTIISSTHFRGNIYGTSWHYWVVTPAIDLTPNVGEGVLLNIDAALTPYSSSNLPNMYTGVDDRFLIAVSIDGGNTWNPANVTEWNNSGTGQFVYNDVPMHGTTYRINLSDYTGHVVKIGFYGESSVSNADNWFQFGNISLVNVDATTYVDTICEGYSFSKNGFDVPYDQLHVGLNAVSRYEVNPDSTISLTVQQIIVMAASVTEIPVTLCEGEHYNGYGFDFTASVSQNIRRRVEGGNIFGCDSTVILKVTVNPVVHAEEHIGVNADSYTYKGKTYYQSTVISDTASAVTGCDSITTIYLTFCDRTVYRYHNAFCAGSSYSDEFFENLTAPGEYSGTRTDMIGCVSSAELTLHQLASGQNYVDSVHVSNLPYVLGNDTLCPETDQPGFVYHGSKDFGCGMVNVTIYVYDKVALNNVAASTLQIAPNPVRIGEDIKILTSVDLSSDYSCRVFDAVGKLVYETDEPSTIIPGLPVAGAYTVRISSGTTIYQGKLIVK